MHSLPGVSAITCLWVVRGTPSVTVIKLNVTVCPGKGNETKQTANPNQEVIRSRNFIPTSPEFGRKSMILLNNVAPKLELAKLLF
jgi:hypothetical protein